MSAENLCLDIGGELFDAESTSDDVLGCEGERRYGILSANLEQMKRVRYVKPAKDSETILAADLTVKEICRAYGRHGRLGSS